MNDGPIAEKGLRVKHVISAQVDVQKDWHWVECSCGAWRYTMNTPVFIATVFAQHVLTETLTRAALDVDTLLLRVAGFSEPWDRGYCQGVQDAAYAVRELRGVIASEKSES